MGFEKLKERFRGREAWQSINLMLIFGIYAVMVIFTIILPQYLFEFFIVIGFIIVSYIAFQQHYYRIKEKERKGDEVFGGWIEHRHGKGELKYFYPKEIVPYERLSEIDQKAVDDFIKFIINLTAQEKRIGIGVDEPPKLLTYEEREQEEQEELQQFEEMYKQEYEEEIIEDRGDDENG